MDTGLHNHDAGPDFFNAKVDIGGTLWVGNVEIHDKSSDWYAHGHDKDPRYDNVILHVAGVVDTEVRTRSGLTPPQMQLVVPRYVEENYRELLAMDSYPPCYRVIPDLGDLMVHSWMSALQAERLEQKTEAIRQRVDRCGGSWEAGYFVTLARNYGFGVNGDAFEAWAESFPLLEVAHHRDNLFQVEAIFMGQAGLLDANSIPQQYRESVLRDEYFIRLRDEYMYLAHKFSMKPMDAKLWKFLLLRPQNFPYIRLSQLANLYFSHKADISQLIECETTRDIEDTLATRVTKYWETHYTFGSGSKASDKRLSKASLNLLVINTAIPTLFAYGRYKGIDSLCDRAFSLLEQLKAEDNHIVKMWKECGLKVGNAGDSQALIQLKKGYCDKRECLHCRIGYEYLRKGHLKTI